jgi:hypothetical protein
VINGVGSKIKRKGMMQTSCKKVAVDLQHGLEEDGNLRSVHSRPPPKVKVLCSRTHILKGLSHEIFRPVFWPVWMHLGLNVNRLWF